MVKTVLYVNYSFDGNMPLENIRIVLVNPLKGGNVGAVCRAVKNMGLSKVVLVSERELDLREARMMATHASEILEAIIHVSSLEQAVADCSMVVGTSARDGFYRGGSNSPEGIAKEIVELSNTANVAIVFGSEDTGLTNEQIGICTHLVKIPTSDRHTSLNLSHAVMVICYEVFKQALRGETRLDSKDGFQPIVPAQSSVREEFFRAWEEILQESEFINGLNRDHIMLRVRKIFSNLKADNEDVGILIGIARQIRWRSLNTPRRSK